MDRSLFVICWISLATGCHHEDVNPPDMVMTDGHVPDAEESFCNPVTQNGCSPGEKCTWVGGAVSCAPNGNLPRGAGCEDDDDRCAAGDVCVSGLCVQFCFIYNSDFGDSTPPGVCESGLCGVPIDGIGPWICSTTCDPLQTSGPDCPDAYECYYPMFYGTPGCLPVGSKHLNESCNVSNECDSQLTCSTATIPTLGYASCLRRCTSQGDECDDGQICAEGSAASGWGTCL